MEGAVKILFACGTQPVMERVIQGFRGIYPNVPLVVVSEFRPSEGEWIPYQIKRSRQENIAFIQARLKGRPIHIAAVIFEPDTPYFPLRRIGFQMAPLRLLVYNETGHHFRLHPRSAAVILRHCLWRFRHFLRKQWYPGGVCDRAWALIRYQSERELWFAFRRAWARGSWLAANRRVATGRALEPTERPQGVSVVIPSRDGRDLLAGCLPRIEGASEIIVVDNGSTDGTAEFLASSFPEVILESSAEPLSFARAVNRGVRRARFSHVCMLNNDMLVEPGFLQSLQQPFTSVPDLFASSAQIFFPEGQRREETGKPVMPERRDYRDFPLRCDEPLEGESQTWVLYGSGGCTMFDRAKLEALGNLDESFEPAYCEDLDLGFRAWLRGWPSVYCGSARVLHQHRATTSRYYTPEQLDDAVQLNFLRFLANTVPDRNLFTQLWTDAMLRLKVAEKAEVLRKACGAGSGEVPAGSCEFLDLVRGDIAVFPGKPRSGKPLVLIVSPYLPFPLSHGAAVRIYNLMRETAGEFDLILAALSEQLAPVPKELLELCVEVVNVRRKGTHALPSSSRPDAVEEFDLPSFHQALRWTMAKWRPPIVQLEFTQMALYVPDCAPAKTILVEHDITYDLYAQMLAREEDWETRGQYERWIAFEQQAWKDVDRVVTMSEKDSRVVPGSVVIANGVDLERFQPSADEPEPARLLFIGSFAHRPNVLAMEFFLEKVFPKLEGVTLHVIAGVRHQRFWDIQHPGVEVEGFVSDVRPAYRRATIVIAPLVASAGTNIKIMEAMAMGKAIVSSSAGIHGLELTSGRNVVVTDAADEMAAEITRLLRFPNQRKELEAGARATAEQQYGWAAIAQEQKRLYRSFC